MSGGKSQQSSSSTSSSSQETVTLGDQSGVVGGAIQGQTVNVTGLVGDDLSSILSKVINLSDDAISGAGSLSERALASAREISLLALEGAGKIGNQALTQVGQTAQDVVLPEKSLTQSTFPIMALAAGTALVGIVLWKVLK